jgi:long-chain fatty acid transport protein
MKNIISANGSILGSSFSLASTLLLTSMSTNISAAGFSFAEQSVKGLGSAFSGGSASADDASTVWYNPAGMTRYSGTHLSSVLHLILPKTEYSNWGSIITPALTGGATVPLGGSNGVREKDAIVPNFYIVHKVDDKMSVGLGINAPFGLVTDHDSDWAGRYHALRSDLATVNINPSVAFKATSNFSVGIGINIQYVDVKLSRAIDTSAACLSAASRGAVLPAATCGALGLTTPGSPATDSQVRLEADDWSYGYNIGFLYEPSSNTRLGLHYRSSIKHRVEGRAEFFYSNPATGMFGAGAGLANQGITASVDLPESVSLSGFHQINSQWSIQGDITWLKWDRFKEFRIRFDTGAPTDSVTPEKWENTLRYAVGANYMQPMINLPSEVVLPLMKRPYPMLA